jgi:hypothetical protein
MAMPLPFGGSSLFAGMMPGHDRLFDRQATLLSHHLLASRHQAG